MTESADGQDDRFPVTNSEVPFTEVPFTEVRYAEIRNELDSVRRALIDLTATVDRLGALIPPPAPDAQTVARPAEAPAPAAEVPTHPSTPVAPAPLASAPPSPVDAILGESFGRPT